MGDEQRRAMDPEPQGGDKPEEEADRDLSRGDPAADLGEGAELERARDEAARRGQGGVIDRE